MNSQGVLDLLQGHSLTQVHADSETDACREDQRTGHVFSVRTAGAQQQLCDLDTPKITLLSYRARAPTFPDEISQERKEEEG